MLTRAALELFPYGVPCRLEPTGSFRGVGIMGLCFSESMSCYTAQAGLKLMTRTSQVWT